MNFQPDCPMERGGLAVLAWGNFAVGGCLARDDPSQAKPDGLASSPEGGALFVLTVRCVKAPPSGELASRSDD